MGNTKVEGCLAAIIVLVVGIPLSAAAYSLAAMLNWNWFITTLGAPRIGFVQAYGLSLVISCFFTPHQKIPKEPEKELSEAIVEMFVMIVARFAALVGFGWACHRLLVAVG
jgi:ribose/xylose/arabinose/galactoside ABC-type transport system permease subunit